MDTKNKQMIVDAIVSSSTLNNITFENACVLLEEYIFEKKQQREVICPTMQCQDDIMLFNHFIEVALTYFKAKFNCVKIFDKQNKLISIRFS